MSGPEPTMDLQARREADRKLSEQRREARRDYVRYAEQAAQADREYRTLKATKFLEYRHVGEAVEASKIRAEGDSADARHRRDIAVSLAKASLLRIEEAERDSVSVRDIHNSSQRIDGVVPSA